MDGDWQAVMNETRGSWKNHPVFRDMKDAVEMVDWLRQKENSNKSCSQNMGR